MFSQEPSKEPEDTVLVEIKEHYDQGEYYIAIGILESTLANAPRGSLDEYYTYLALCYAQNGIKFKAQEHFKHALRNNADLRLPPNTPANIAALFNETKRELSSEAAMCSCIMPGMGQMLKGETSKAKRMMLAFGLSAFAAGASWVITLNKHSAYLELGPADIGRLESAYNSYNTWYHTSLALTAVLACVYIYNMFDASAVRMNHHAAAGRPNVFLCAQDGDVARFCLVLRF
jgi:tetratricopeptide (TPR) repeat protein